MENNEKTIETVSSTENTIQTNIQNTVQADIKEDSEVIISLRNIWKIYPMGDYKVTALKDINLDIRKGDFVAIIGSSGSGKSTMMNMIGCLDIPTEGDVYLYDKNISKLSESNLSELRGRSIGFIFQQYNLIPSMSALENVMLPLQFQDVNDKDAKKRTIRVLEMVGLGDRIKNLPTQLSGGQQQRVSIARALACNPDILLADEPTGALDSKTGTQVLKILQKLWKSGKTIIMITHDLNLAKYANTQVELKDGQIIRNELNKNRKDFEGLDDLNLE
ncbi:putative ABC transport system ATP-binding protein [Methanococcus voltae]|uniref:ABC transport system ATP-binding protein n=3 Tax=Methanococcus voltae TaxID=2188 RepID=A0ABT2EVS4_METVO|nr:putative ABC transport system ATP-binding protein [Methanococcus voltae]MBP2200797.1 putative ABC transport system ATP-binding protein [Methanococcus voltae]MCS3921521.1 putative ABC transport system ATP-binding protein [Methanococcus voltae PS]